MKKLLCIALVFASFFTLSAESMAITGVRSEIKDCDTIPIKLSRKKIPDKNSAFQLKEISFSEIKPKKQKPNHCTTANLTIVDSDQVKVKYDFWIVKVLKDLFKLN